MYEYRIYGDDRHLYWMGILLERSRRNYNEEWNAAVQNQYLWEENDNPFPEVNHLNNNNNLDENDINNNDEEIPEMPVVELDSDAEWDDGWTGHPLEVHQSSDFISCLMNLLKSIKLKILQENQDLTFHYYVLGAVTVILILVILATSMYM